MKMKYKTVIGLEMHCELCSNSKVFSRSKNSYSITPNSNINEIDMAFPGTLPDLNKKSVKDAIKMALILNCKIPRFMIFDRKNYFYPDLPKGYQITQFTSPIGTNGNITIKDKDNYINVKIHDIHLEEDSASMQHFDTTSLIDYNRAGVPLLELVTEPCFHSADEAITFLEYMRSVYQYTGISQADTKKGQVRCDVNISIMDENEEELGTRVEIKNVNSFSNVYDAINYEIERQSKLKEENRYDEVVQETRRFDEETKTTIRMRSKADAVDYKYFVEPNIPRILITDELIEEIKKTIPRLKNERKEDYITKYGLSDYDANILVKEKNISDYFEECIKLGMNPKEACNLINVNILSYLNKNLLDIENIYLTPSMLKYIVDNINNQTISSKQAKEIIIKVLDEKKEPSNFISKENSQITDEEELNKIIDKIISENQSQVELYRNGKDRLFDFFVGQMMKETHGKANPVRTKELLHEKLDKR
jgi:aspartyl-tRNA(Asn)/glutamyl-tRNA(Gln) amidotransferase subunit B